MIEGFKIPQVTFRIREGDTSDNEIACAIGGKWTNKSTDDFFKNKKVILFSLPGAFTPTCSVAHMPGFVVKYDEIIAKGVDTVACLSVNDAFVMNAWKDASNADNILMLADGNCTFTTSLGLELDGTGFGMGMRSKRFAIIVNDGVVELLNVDESGFELSSAEAVLEAL